MTELPPGAIVHIFEADQTPGRIALPNRVAVNGVDVGLLRDFAIAAGSPCEPTVVTLELLPRTLIIGETP